MFQEIANITLFAGSSIATIIAVLFCVELHHYSKLMNTRQKIINVLTTPAMAMFSLNWTVNVVPVRFFIVLLVWIGCIIDLFHLCKEERGWKLTNVVEFVILSFLLCGCGAVWLIS